MIKKQLGRRALAVCLCLSMGVCGLTGCGDDDEESADSSETSYDFDDTDAEYGSTLREDDSYYDVLVEYDKRYLEDEEVEALASYFYAIQEEDEELFDTWTPAFYMDWYLENAYEGILTESAYLAMLHSDFGDAIDSDDYTFARLSVTSVTEQTDDDINIATNITEEDTGDEGIPVLIEMYLEVVGMDAYEEFWQGCKVMTIDVYITDDESTVSYGSVTVFIPQINDGYYVCA